MIAHTHVFCFPLEERTYEQHTLEITSVTGFTGSPGAPLISMKPILGPLEPPLVIYRNESNN